MKIKLVKLCNPKKGNDYKRNHFNIKSLKQHFAIDTEYHQQGKHRLCKGMH